MFLKKLRHVFFNSALWGRRRVYGVCLGPIMKILEKLGRHLLTKNWAFFFELGFIALSETLL